MDATTLDPELGPSRFATKEDAVRYLRDTEDEYRELRQAEDTRRATRIEWRQAPTGPRSTTGSRLTSLIWRRWEAQVRAGLVGPDEDDE